MKFLLKSTTGSGRLGVISNIARLPDFEMETPHAFLYTQGGTVPHLTEEVLQMVTTKTQALQVPVPKISNLQDRLKTCKLSISEFIGMKEYFTFCTFIEPGEKRTSGFHEKGKVPLWGRNGKKYFTSAEYMELMEDLNPDMFLVLADGDTDSESSKKRTAKSYERSVTFFENCMELYEKSDKLKTSGVIGAVEGGFDLVLRENFSKLLGESSVFGVAVDGLHNCSDDVSSMSFDVIRDAVKASLKHIPDDKLRIIHGCWNPSVVLDLIETGIDMFDSTYPYLVTEKAGALIFPNNERIFDSCGLNDIKSEISQIKLMNGCSKPEIEKIEEPEPKKIKLMTESKYCISMADPRYVTDFSPILKNCKCYTCQNHTRAYIHHLVSVHELLGPALLMMHNLHHYLLFLSTIRKAISAGRFTDLKKCFQAWYKKVDNTPS